MPSDEIPTDDAADAQQGNWTIKAVPLRSRLLAKNSAARAHKSIPAWLEWAIDMAAYRQGQSAILPPVGEPQAVSLPPSKFDALPLPPALVTLAALARETTPEGKDSAAMKAVRTVIHLHAKALSDEIKSARANLGPTDRPGRANLALPAPAKGEQ